MLLRAALPLLLLSSCASQPELVINPHFRSAWPTLPELQTAADAGKGGALFELGDAYELGLGVKPDLAKAMALYRQAGARGEPRALVRLGWGHQTGLWDKVDIAAALDAYVAADALSCPEASLALARLFAEGADGAPKSEAMAEFWYRRNFEVIQAGDDSRQCKKFNCGKSALALMSLYDRHQDSASLVKMEKLWGEIFDDSSIFGVDEAGALLAERYLNGIGTPKDFKKALAYVEAGEDASWDFFHRSEAVKGRMYEFGEGLPKDLCKAEKCYRNARSFHDPVPLLRVMAGQGKIGEADFWKQWIYAYRSPEIMSNKSAGRQLLVTWQKSMPADLPPDQAYQIQLAAVILGNLRRMDADGNITLPDSRSPAERAFRYLPDRPFRTPRDLQEEQLNKSGGLPRVINLER